MNNENINIEHVAAFRRGSKYPCTISYWYNGDSGTYDLEFNLEGVPSKTFHARDVFACFCDLREHLRAFDTILLCNGACLDAYPSRMSRDMGSGRLIYVTRMGHQARDADMVDLFDEAPAEKIASVEEQGEFHRKWLDSLGG